MPEDQPQLGAWAARARTTVTDLFAYQRSDGTRVARSTIDDPSRWAAWRARPGASWPTA